MQRISFPGTVKYIMTQRIIVMLIVRKLMGPISRFSDDGEPSGTAGKPVLMLLEHKGITNALLIVVRYFGGTKLGTGGLVRAYTDTARAVIEQSNIVSVPVLKSLRITFPYDHTSGVMHIISHNKVKIIDTEYGDDVTLHLGIRPSMIESFVTHVRDVTAGNIAIIC
jgi:putative IMPACT (imprinted ancient) family translation regulator